VLRGNGGGLTSPPKSSSQNVMVHFKMKQTIIFILTLFLTLTAVGQENYKLDSIKTRSYRNEIGINMFNITYLYRIPYFYPDNGTNYRIFNGLMYKRHFNKNAIRIGFDYCHSSDSYVYYPEIYYQKSETQFNMAKLRLGYERKFTLSKIQPFIAIDQYFSFGINKTITEGNCNSWYGNYYYYQYRNVTQENIIEVGIEPVIGLKYQIIKRLSLAIEIDAVLYVKHIGGNVPHRTKMGFAFNPLRLFSFNFHF
jgi:hypothetical protein